MKNSNFLRIYTEIVNEKLPENNLECILNALWPAGRDFDNSLKLGICISGSGVLYSDYGSQNFREDNAMIIFPNQKYKLYAYEPHTKWVCMETDVYRLFGESSLINAEYAYKLLKESYDNSIIICGSKYGHIKDIIKKILSASSDKLEYKIDFVALHMCELFLELKKFTPTTKHSVISGNSNVPDVIKPAIKTIENQYNKEIKIDELASICYLSPAGFRRKFNEAMGVSPKSYLTNVRIKMAQLLLKRTDLTICEIASRVGYANVSPFGRSFKLITGCSPKEYRDKFGKPKLKDPYPIIYSNSLEKFRIGAWYAIDAKYLSDEFIRDIARAGINLIFVGYDYSLEREFILKYSYLYGIECILVDNSLFKGEKLRIDDYMSSSAFLGNMIIEYPMYHELGVIGKRIESYSKKLHDKIPFVVLYPMYASGKQMGIDDYRQYINTFADNCIEKVLCVNIYPCYIGHEYKKLTYKDYLQNLSIVSEACRKNNLDMWIIIQSISFHESVRIPDKIDLRWQMYCCLSFGAKSITHFCYCLPVKRPGSIDVFSGAMISIKGEKTDTWYNAREVNYEIHRLSDTYMSHNHLGAFLVNEDSELPYMHFENQYTDFKYIRKLNCDKPLLVGCFEKANGNGVAFTLVNMTDLWKNESVVVSFETVPCKKLCVYKNGYANESLETTYTVELSCGEGVFVTLDF